MIKYYVNTLISVIILILITNNVLATAQFPDLLIYGKDTFLIFSNPLEQYLKKKKERIFCGEKLEMSSTACYRGYQAVWKIKEGSLFLHDVMKGCGESSNNYFKLKNEFGTKEVFSSWFTGIIKSPRGELLQYVHAGYGSIYEEEKYFYITKGVIDSVVTMNYLVYDNSFLNPSQNRLQDTLRKIMIKNLDLNKFSQISDNDACEIVIRFNSKGVIDSIYNGYDYDGISLMEKYILSVADTSFKHLPRLMNVTHERYYPPIISLYFDGHCLKNPCDYKYGCDDYGCKEKKNELSSGITVYKKSIIRHTLIKWGVIVILSVILIVLLRYRIKKR